LVVCIFKIDFKGTKIIHRSSTKFSHVWHRVHTRGRGKGGDEETEDLETGNAS